MKRKGAGCVSWVVSDIHGNWPALAAINEPYDFAVCLGDLVDYGPDPLRCVRWAMTNARHAIRGNHDHGASQAVEVSGEAGYRYLTRVSRALVWETLGVEERRYLIQLPLTCRFTVQGRRFLMVHGTPRDPLDEYVMRDPEVWAERLKDCEADVVLVGHSHMQFNLKVGSSIVINPGSVGNPRDGDPRAAYAIIDGNKIELKRVEYPVEETIKGIEALPLPDRAKEMFRDCYVHGRMNKSLKNPEHDGEEEL